MKKRLASLFLALSLMAVPAAAFSDVAEGRYYTDAVRWAVDEGITTGTTSSTFSPSESCTRGQILTFLWRAADAPEPAAEIENPFSDVTEEAHYYQPVLWALEKGILESGETLDPGAPCTRAETMLYLWRFAGSPETGEAAFSDIPEDAAYAPAVAWAVEAGITGGTTETTFSPDNTCTRGQIVTFLYRSLGDSDEETSVPVAEVRPMQTLRGDGNARSLGLNGSEFVRGTVYEASAQAEIYSSREAVFTITVPFPLYQASNYAVRFTEDDSGDNSGISYAFSYLRWDEAFSGVVDWQGEHYVYRFLEMTEHPKTFILDVSEHEDDRMGGVVTWRVTLPEESRFRFDTIEQYRFDCDVSFVTG